MKLTLLSGFEFDTSNVFRIYFNGDLQTADVLDLNGEPLCTIRGSHEYENLRSLCEGDFDDLRRKAWEIDGRVPPRRMFPDKTAPQMNVKGVAEAIAAVAGSRLHPTHIHSAVPVTAAASASPAPAPERVNLWTAVQAAVVTGRHSIGRTWEGMQAAGYPRDWFLWGYRIHDRLIPGRGL